jgi:hypothetical protein
MAHRGCHAREHVPIDGPCLVVDEPRHSAHGDL